MTEGFVLDGLPAIRFPYLRCDISQLERLCTEVQTISEKLEQAKKDVAALSVFHSRLHNEKIVRFNVQSIKTTASARYAPLLTDGFDLSAVPIALFVDLVCFVPIPYLKTLASHDETLRHAMELTKGRSLHAQWGTYFTFLMKVDEGWAQRFSDEVQAHLASTRPKGFVHANGSHHNDSSSREVRGQSSTFITRQHPLDPNVDSGPSTTIHGVQSSNPDQIQTTARESMYLRAIGAKEKEWGPDHPTTLDTIMELGSLYADEGRRQEAERMFTRALLGYERVEAGNNTNQQKQEVLRKLQYLRHASTKA